MVIISMVVGWSAVLRLITPLPEEIAPCSCRHDFFGNRSLILPTILLHCGTFDLGDDRVSEILNIFLTNVTPSPLTSIYMYYSRLTRVPQQISLLPRLTLYVGLDYNIFNLEDFTGKPVALPASNMTTLSRGSFRFSLGTLGLLSLTYNQLTAIEPEFLKPFRSGRLPIGASTDGPILHWTLHLHQHGQ